MYERIGGGIVIEVQKPDVPAVIVDIPDSARRGFDVEVNMPRGGGSATAVSRTTTDWESRESYVPGRGEIIEYCDRFSMTGPSGETILIPGIKYGDGETKVGDLPFAMEDTIQQAIETGISYNRMTDKPRIGDVELIGNRTVSELGAEPEQPIISQLEILQIVRDA